MESEIKGKAFDVSIETAEETHKAPESFNGVEGIASVNAQMRKRGTNSPLNADKLEILETADSKLLTKVSKALLESVDIDAILADVKDLFCSNIAA